MAHGSARCGIAPPRAGSWRGSSGCSLGNFGDAKSVGEGIHELRMDFGPGYRVYFTRRGTRIVLLLCGGDKGSQSRDIARAKQIASELE